MNWGLQWILTGFRHREFSQRSEFGIRNRLSRSAFDERHHLWLPGDYQKSGKWQAQNVKSTGRQHGKSRHKVSAMAQATAAMVFSCSTPAQPHNIDATSQRNLQETGLEIVKMYKVAIKWPFQPFFSRFQWLPWPWASIGAAYLPRISLIAGRIGLPCSPQAACARAQHLVRHADHGQPMSREKYLEISRNHDCHWEIHWEMSWLPWFMPWFMPWLPWCAAPPMRQAKPAAAIHPRPFHPGRN